MNYSNKVSFDRCVLHNCEVETFFFYTFIAIVFLVIGGIVLAFIFGLYMDWQAPPPIDFRDESYGQLGIPELERLSGVQFGQEITEAFEAMKGDAQNIAERYSGYIKSGFGSYEEAMASDLSDGVKDALKAHFDR